MANSFTTTIPKLLAELDGFHVEVSPERERADIILDRPPFNVISMREREQLAAVFTELDRDSRVRVVVMRAAGEHFSSGGDIPGFMAQSPEHLSELARNVGAPERCHKPVIAAIQGYCFGVALEFALACDFRVLTEGAELGQPEQRIGMITGSGGSIRLLKMVGISRAKEVAMRSRRIPADEAYRWGIALKVVPKDELAAAIYALVEELRGFSPLAQRTLKQVLNSAQDAPLHVGLELEGQAYGRLRSSEDFREGVESFGAKRKPRFTGR